MATILDNDIQVDFLADTRQKRLSWLGGGGINSSYTMNQLYSAMATLLDETTTIDDGTCFSAETPVEYTIGKIDSGDTEPWYITFDLMERITGGALRTSGWLRETDINTGIICVPVAPGGNIVAADAGNTVVGQTTGAGTLLEFIDTGKTYDYCIIRPDGVAAANDFTTATQNVSANGHFAVQWSTAASTTGDQIWANLYSLGTIDPNVHLYLYQGITSNDTSRVRLSSWNNAAGDWYGNGHINICVALKDIELSTWAIVDAGYITVLGRKYGDLYTSFEVACSNTSGGRNPIPLQSAADLDNATGIKIVTTGAFTGGPYTVGEIITGAVSGARGILTAQVANTSLTYIPIDDPVIDFHSLGAEQIDGTDSLAYADSTSSPASTGPALNTWFTSNVSPSASFTHSTYDVDDNGTDENYGIVIDCKSNPLSEVYQWIKYATRNGETTYDLDGVNGERYVGGEVYLTWAGAVTDVVAEGADVTQATSLATGMIIAFDDTNNVILLRDTRGTFNAVNVVTDNDNAGYFTPTSVSTFAPKTASPLGTFAGGTFFGARGVLLSNWLTADENAFILTPIEGGTVERPAAVNIAVSNLAGGAATSNLHDRVGVFRLTGAGGNINKAQYTCDGGESAGDATITVGGAIAQDIPGKTAGGILVIVDDPTGTGDEYKLRFASWLGLVFTLNEITGSATAGTGATTLIDSLATFTDGDDQVYRGDLVYVTGRSGWAYVKTVDSNTQLTLEGTGIVGFVDTDPYEINVPPIGITAGDKIYVPFIDKVATSDEENVSVIYVGTIHFRVKVRNTRATIKIKPFSVDGSTSGTDQSIATIRTTDTIIT